MPASHITNASARFIRLRQYPQFRIVRPAPSALGTDMISMRAMKPLCSGINVSTSAGSNARTSPDFPDQQKQFTGRSR